MVEFTGQIFCIESKVPVVVIGALRNGEVAGSANGPAQAAPLQTATFRD